MILCFELTMPNNNSWNGKWSGEKDYYAIVESIRDKVKAQELLDKGYWYYNFGDGWGAGVSVKEVTATEAKKTRKKSIGFCGYNWMVRSIKLYNEIRSNVN